MLNTVFDYDAYQFNIKENKRNSRINYALYDKKACAKAKYHSYVHKLMDNGNTSSYRDINTMVQRRKKFMSKKHSILRQQKLML